MKFNSVTFTCDKPKCSDDFTVLLYGDEPSSVPFLTVMEHGWQIKRPIRGGWQYFCPTHANRVKQDSGNAP